MDFVSFGKKRTFEDISSQVSEPTRDLFGKVRDFCLSLGSNVVEDVRMHRIVFGKSMTFRWFADVETSDTQIIIKLQVSRKEPPTIHKISSGEDFDSIKKDIKNAYEKIL